MELLKSLEYDKSYFDGKQTRYMHNAGYSVYIKTEIFLKRAKKIDELLSVKGKSILEIACAKGYLVNELVGLGADAIGFDVSEYAIGKAIEEHPGISERFFVADAREKLKDYADEHFDVLIITNALCCFSDGELKALLLEINRISKRQFFIVTEAIKKFYNSRTLEEWNNDFKWKIGTVLMSEKNNEILIKE